MKPILFNSEMVKAILDGRKTVTRRVIKFNNGQTPVQNKRENLHGTFDKLNNQKGFFAGFYKESDFFMIDGERHVDALYSRAYYRPGDVMYVRETFAYSHDPNDEYFVYKADGEPCYPYYGKELGNKSLSKQWLPSLHMPKEAARIFLKVTGVRVERLQDMKTDDVIKEGAYPVDAHYYGRSRTQLAFELWEELWNSTIKKIDLDRYGWDANPFVWVIEFERCEKEVEEGK